MCIRDRDYYRETAKLIPKRKRLSLVDLGVGTGLELDEIFQQNPGVTVTGIDISEGMLRKLREKNRKRMEQVQAVKGNFFEYDFGIERYDGAVSVMSMHYFEPQAKLELYRKLGRSLKKGGFYLETDLYAPNGEYEPVSYTHLSQGQTASSPHTMGRCPQHTLSCSFPVAYIPSPPNWVL